MIKRIAAQVAVVGIGAFALFGLGAVSSVLTRADNLVGPTVVAAEVRTEPNAVALAEMRGQLKATRQELERAHQILDFSGRYGIPADLSATIYDNAVAEGIPAAVGFQLVKIESDFKNTAASYASAIGLTQLRLPTARAYDSRLNESDLHNPDVNLQIGFRYLKDLLKRFDNNVALALEAYNKGPTLVAAQQELGTQIEGKYSRAILSGLRKRT
ncbi:MAG: transglycosylase SLT domain-containing protein [Gemmatimonadales bacterium]